MFITILNDIITGFYDGDKKGVKLKPQEVFQDVGEAFQGYKNLPMSHLENGILKPIAELVSEGVMVLEANKKIFENRIIEKTELEQMIEGILPIPENMEIKDNQLVPILSLTEVKTQYINKITLSREEKLAKGFSYGIYTIQADADSKANAHAFLTLGESGSLTYPIVWRTKDNSYFHIVGLTELKTFTGAMMSFIQTIYNASWVVKDSILASESKTQIESLYNNYI